MGQEELGRCHICSRMESEPHAHDCQYFKEECSECGEEFDIKHFNCFTHLESTEDLRDYAHGLVESHKNIVDGGVEALKKLGEKIDQLELDKAVLIKGFVRQVDFINQLIWAML